MAKSLRSKWRRKCRAVKRERYGAKELERLKKTLGINENADNIDANMTDISQVATVVDARTIKESVKGKHDVQEEQVENMEEDGARVYNKKTMRDQYGNYPVWMNRRQILKHKKGRAKSKKAAVKSTKRLTRKQKKAAAQKT